MSFPFDPEKARDLHIADSSDEGLDKPKSGKPSLRIVK
jgi:stringent starvation protein B